MTNLNLTHLGRMLSQHTISRRKARTAGIFLVGFFTAAGVAISMMGSPTPGTRMVIIGGALGIGVGLGLLVQLAVRLTDKKPKNFLVAVYDQGLFYRGGATERVIRWDDIATYQASSRRVLINGVSAGTYHSSKLVLHDGSALMLDDVITNVEALGQCIDRTLARLRTPELTRAVQAGETVRFGDFAVDRHGLTVAGREIAWGAIGGLAVREGCLVVRDAQNTVCAIVPYGEVPNACCCLSVCASMMGGDLV